MRNKNEPRVEPVVPSAELEELVEEMEMVDFLSSEGQDEGIRTPESAGADSAEPIDPVEKAGRAGARKRPVIS